MKIRKLNLALALLALPSIAMASDEWDGFYAGIHVGVSDADLSRGPAAISDHSGVYGLQIGYNHSLTENWVIGGELSYGTEEYGGLGPSKDMDTARLKLKAGYDFGQTMVYGVLGYANIELGTTTEQGTTYGIGLGYKATDNIILNAEILRDSFDIRSSGFDVEKTSLALGVSYQF